MSLVKSYVLKWNNFSKVLSYNFDDYLQKQKYCDVTLSVEGKFIKVHKMVLAASSKYFEQMFDLSNDRQVIILSDITYKDLCNIIAFAYKGEATVSSESFESFMQTAKTLQVKGIINNDEIPDKTPPSPPPSLHDKWIEEKAVKTALNDTPRIKEEMDISDIEEDKKVNFKMQTKATQKTRKRKANELEVSTEKVNKEDSLSSEHSSTCNFCHTSYSKKTIKGHERRCKWNPDRIVHQCPICLKGLSRIDKLNVHIEMHNRSPGAKPNRKSV